MYGLDISYNDIDDKGAIALSQCIHLIEEINISGCCFTYVGIESIAKALIESDHQVGCKLEFLLNAFGEIL